MPEPAPPDTAVPRNRRAHQRYALVGRAATLDLDGRSLPCVVRNISSTGLMAVIYQADLAADRAAVRFDAGPRLSGSVLWTRDWQLGLIFDEPIDVEPLLASLGETDAQPDRRSERRFPVDCAAKLRVNNRYYFGRVADISSAGARFLTKGRLKKIGAATLVVPDLPPLACTIRWAREGEIGVQFQEAMPEPVLDPWVAERSVGTAARINGA